MSEIYRIFLTNEFSKRKRKLSKTDQSFVEKKLTEYVFPQLRRQPYYGANIRKLVKYDPATWRYRTGRFRVFSLIEEQEKVVYVLTLEPRKSAY